MERNGNPRSNASSKRKHSTSPTISDHRPHKLYHKDPSFHDHYDDDAISSSHKQPLPANPIYGGFVPAPKNGGDIDLDDQSTDSETEGMSAIVAAAELQLGSPEFASRLPTLAVKGTTDTAEWQRTIEGVVKNVVSIRFCQTCSFDTDEAITSEATGFVVDVDPSGKRGYGFILTNRHVVCAGPFWGYCIFDNHEECDVYPIYRDPVHDFGFLRFDPKQIKHMPLNALELRPDLAQVGVEIRVVGNDAGEKLSILSGIISRLDRNAPDYGDGYNDFNTNYIQAAASASGGSSGSPVINVDGYAVALQAGGSVEAATDFFLPLDRPLRALRCLQRGEPVTRGTIQTQWYYRAFEECRRLGLTPEWEAVVRKNFPKEIGMLSVEIVLPEGPAHGLLEEGDILVQVNGELITQFLRLDEIMDSNVGKKVKLLVQRGGLDVEVEVTVGNLHTITPDRYLTVCGAAFHNLSYQYARQYGIACRGVFVCEPSGSFKSDGSERGWLLESIDNKKTPDLDTFIEVMKGIPDRARVVVTYRFLRDMHTLHTCIINIDRHWTKKMRMGIRNDETGLWDFKDIADPLPPRPVKPHHANFISLTAEYPAASDLLRGFVRIVCNMPLKLDGYPRARKTGCGLVVDATKGLVVVSRAIVPHDLCDITVHVAESILVEAKVLFLHPLQNYTIIQYDPSLVQAPVKAPILASEPVKQGMQMTFLGFNHNFRVVMGKTSVTDVTTIAVPACGSAPRYRALNVDAITVDTNLSSQCGTGVLADEEGVVRALWLTFLGDQTQGKEVEYHLGLAANCLVNVIRSIQNGVIPKLRMLPVELNLVSISQARIMGISDTWVRRVETENTERHQLFMIRKVECGHSNNPLEEGDVILAVNDKVLTRISELDVMYTEERLEMVILRKCQELRLTVPTISTEGLETNRAIIFCGAVLHSPHHAVRQQISKLHSEIYVAARMRGSPAYQYGLHPTSFIVAVNGVKTSDINEFLMETSKIPDNTYFRLRIITFDNVPWILTMKKNEHYFPTVEYVKECDRTWTVRTFERGGEVMEGVEGGTVSDNMEEMSE